MDNQRSASASPPEPLSNIKRAWSALRDFPIPAISFFGVILAVVFNLGYFAAVGLQFINIFPLQESIMFSITGAAISASLITTGQLIFNIFDVRINFRKRDWHFALNIVIIATIITLLGYQVYSVAIDFYEHGGKRLSTLFVVLAVSTVITILLYFLHRHRPSIHTVVLILLFFSITILLSGIFYGHYTLLYDVDKPSMSAITQDGRSAKVVRMGSQYTLVTFGDGLVHLVRTESLKDVASKID